MRNKICINDIAKYSKGQQINRDRLTKCGDYDYLNGGIYPSGKWSKYNVSANTVTISEGGNSSGYVNYMIEPFWCGAHCYYLYDVKGNTKYLYYALKSQQNRLMSIRSGACMPNIKKKDLGAFEFYYDNDQIAQNQIVSILQCIENTIVIRKRELNFIDNIIKARFCELFESDGRLDAWESRTLLKCCKDKDDIKCGPFGSQLHAEDYIKEGIPVYGIPEVNSAFTAEPRIFVSPEKAGLLQAYNIKEGDIAVSRKGNVGQAALFSDKNTPGIIHSDVLRVRVNHDLIDANYLIGALHNSQKVLHQIIMVSTGAIMPGINVTKLKNITIDIPPIKLQREYGEFVKQVDKSKLPLQNPAYGYSIFLAINRIYAVRQDIKASAAG